MALYDTKKAQTYKVLLNPHFEFYLYENFQVVKVISWSGTDLTMQFS